MSKFSNYFFIFFADDITSSFISLYSNILVKKAMMMHITAAMANETGQMVVKRVDR